MAGLLAWLILFTWVAITIVATKAGYKSFKRRFQSKRGCFFGAMLGFNTDNGHLACTHVLGLLAHNICF